MARFKKLAEVSFMFAWRSVEQESRVIRDACQSNNVMTDRKGVYVTVTFLDTRFLSLAL